MKYPMFSTVTVDIATRPFTLEMKLNQLSQAGIEIVSVFPLQIGGGITPTSPVFIDSVKVVVRYDSSNGETASKLEEIKRS